jgi:hypothetical protein
VRKTDTKELYFVVMARDTESEIVNTIKALENNRVHKQRIITKFFAAHTILRNRTWITAPGKPEHQ